MSSQFVDINGDKHNDIVVGSYCGTPYVLYGSKEGFKEPVMFKDREGKRVLIEAFWHEKDKKWTDTDRCGSKGHCTSVAVVDWDGDNDFDLVLGDYREGRMYVRINEGSATEPKFATKNIPVNVGEKAAKIPGGLSAPRVVDWNKDGKFDLICGGYKGGVYLLQNTGSKTEPKFDAMKTLIPKSNKNEFIVSVPAKNGMPTGPGSSFHVDVVDYDNDGDLDLLIGARCSWKAAAAKKPSKEVMEKYNALKEKSAKVQKELMDLMKDVKPEKMKEIVKSDRYKEILKNYRSLSKKMNKLYQPPRDPSGDFVWLLRRK